MKSVLITLYAYKCRTPYPLPVKLNETLGRRGILIRFTEDTLTVWGECAPLPGLHEEPLKQAYTQLREHLSLLKDIRLSHWLEEAARLPQRLLPSVRFALESVLFNRWFLQNSTKVQSLPVNSLALSPNRHDLLTYPVIKVKTGRKDRQQEIANLRELISSLKPGQKIRIDANRAWDFNTALRVLRALPTDIIDYVEEPLKENQRLPELYQETAIPYALDETLRQNPDLSHWKNRGLKALVLKPAILGGLSTALKIQKSHSLPAVISDVFSSSVGLITQARFAALYMETNLAHGLDALLHCPFFPVVSKGGWPANLLNTPCAVNIQELERL